MTLRKFELIGKEVKLSVSEEEMDYEFKKGSNVKETKSTVFTFANKNKAKEYLDFLEKHNISRKKELAEQIKEAEKSIEGGKKEFERIEQTIKDLREDKKALTNLK